MERAIKPKTRNENGAVVICSIINGNTAVLRKVVLQMGKSLCNSVESYYGYYCGFYDCLSEPESVSVRWKETTQARVFVLSPSLLLNHFKPQSSKA